MPQMPLAVRAVHFRANHSMTPIPRRFNSAFKRLEKRWPPASAFVLRRGRKQLTATPGTGVNSRTFFVVQRAGAGIFSTMLQQNTALFRGKANTTSATIGALNGTAALGHGQSPENLRFSVSDIWKPHPLLSRISEAATETSSAESRLKSVTLFQEEIIMSSIEDKIKGATNKVVGKIKEEVGRVTNDEELEGEGVVQNLKGQAQTAKGDVKDAVKKGVDKI